TDVAAKSPDVLKVMTAYAEKAREELGDALTKRPGVGRREPGRVPEPKKAPEHSAELVFPPHPKHNHAPGIVECPNGDLLVSWYRGSGERQADDVAVYGARLKKGGTNWSDA